jgi:hypothetical protein
MSIPPSQGAGGGGGSLGGTVEVSEIESLADGAIIVGDGSGAPATYQLFASSAGLLLYMGGTSSSFPALKRSTTKIQVRLADDSALTGFEAGDIFASTALHLHTNLNAGIFYNGGRMSIWANAAGPDNSQCIFGNGAFIVSTGGAFKWGDPNNVTADLGIGRNAAGVMEINSGSAGTLRDLKARGGTFTGPTSGLGYATGAGGTVTQLTNKATGVTLNTVCGAITMNNAALNAAAEVTFTLTNSAIAATDVIVVNHASAGTAGAYMVGVSAVAAGSCQITVANVSAGNLSEAIVLSFAVIKAVTS